MNSTLLFIVKRAEDQRICTVSWKGKSYKTAWAEKNYFKAASLGPRPNPVLQGLQRQ